MPNTESGRHLVLSKQQTTHIKWVSVLDQDMRDAKSSWRTMGHRKGIDDSESQLYSLLCLHEHGWWIKVPAKWALPCNTDSLDLPGLFSHI